MVETLDFAVADLQKTETVSVPVPPALLKEVQEHPETFGLPTNVSRRQRLGLLLLKGASAGVAEQRDAEREEYYARLASDPERESALAEVENELMAEGLL